MWERHSCRDLLTVAAVWDRRLRLFYFNEFVALTFREKLPVMSAPKHLKASLYSRQGLYAGLTAFSELEQRIAALPDEQSRGDAFEVFAEAYLATQPTHRAREVWPDKAIEPSLRDQLCLYVRDVGADGIMQTNTGEYHGYQVKFRSNRTPLTWEETSTFFGVTDRCNQRFLFTNSDDISAVSEQRKDFYSIRGNDLDRLEVSDFEAIQTWLTGAEVVRERKTPKQHQQEALDEIMPAIEKRDRVTAVMACGSGKTLVALWTTERLGSSKVLVLLPSLALLRQTLHEWLRETSWKRVAFLCVCSDPTVSTELDALQTQPSELDFPVSTNSGAVRQFLDAPFDGVKLVFSTYQSAKNVAEHRVQARQTPPRPATPARINRLRLECYRASQFNAEASHYQSGARRDRRHTESSVNLMMYR